MTDLLRTHDLTKSFGEVRAVRAISLSVRPREIFALLGPNGAGKTTLVRMITHLILPDSGTVEFNYGGQARDRIHASDVGFLPEDRALLADVPILRTLIYHGVMRSMGHTLARREAERWLQRLGLASRSSDPVGTLSKGNQQKVQFIASILHRPTLAVLDEPFSGLDPLNQELFVDLIRELRDEGMTIILSAHHMDLVERIADRVLLLNQGSPVLYGTLDELRQQVGSNGRIVFHHRGEAELGEVRTHSAVAAVESQEPGRVSLRLHAGHTLSDLLMTASAAMEIVAVHSGPMTLRDIYVQALAAAQSKLDSSEPPAPAAPLASPSAHPQAAESL
jgi:ABC-2 type transport system ATP-binding protein